MEAFEANLKSSRDRNTERQRDKQRIWRKLIDEESSLETPNPDFEVFKNNCFNADQRFPRRQLSSIFQNFFMPGVEEIRSESTLRDGSKIVQTTTIRRTDNGIKKSKGFVVKVCEFGKNFAKKLPK